jgi:hypothetical protein
MDMLKNWDSQICAGMLDGSTDTCQGGEKIKIKFKKLQLER